MERGEKCRKKARGGWSQKGETEVPEIIIVSDAVESTFVDFGDKFLEGKERYQAKRVKIQKFEKESDSSGIRRNAGLRKRSKECGRKKWKR